MRYLIPAIVILSVAACQSQEQAVQPPVPENVPPTAQSWHATERGAGSILAGMTIAEAERASGVRLMSTSPAAECTYVRPSSGPDGIIFMVVSGRIARVDVTRAEVPTAAGVRVGDTELRVLEVYGDRAVTRSPHKYTDGHYLTVAPDAGHRLVFETDGARVTRYRGGRLPEVEWVEGCA